MASTATSQKTQTKKQQPSKKSMRKGKQPDENLQKIKHAEARLFFGRAYLKKRKIKLRKCALKVNVQFPGIDEEIWTHEPEVAYKRWRRNTGGKDVTLT